MNYYKQIKIIVWLGVLNLVPHIHTVSLAEKARVLLVKAFGPRDSYLSYSSRFDPVKQASFIVKGYIRVSELDVGERANLIVDALEIINEKRFSAEVRSTEIEAARQRYIDYLDTIR